MTDQTGTDWDFEAVFADALATVPSDQVDRERFVPGVGPLSADVMLVGEAPGAREVAEGRPFVGQTGSQLDRALDRDRREFYVTNLVKVRPPENRDPHVAEIEAWRPVLAAEIDRVDPAVIVPLGRFATDELLGTDETVSEVHGRAFEREVPDSDRDGETAPRDGRLVVPAFHPAAALYDRSKIEAVRSDLRTALERVRCRSAFPIGRAPVARPPGRSVMSDGRPI